MEIREYMIYNMIMIFINLSFFIMLLNMKN